MFCVVVLLTGGSRGLSTGRDIVTRNPVDNPLSRNLSLPVVEKPWIRERLRRVLRSLTTRDRSEVSFITVTLQSDIISLLSH